MSRRAANRQPMTAPAKLPTAEQMARHAVTIADALAEGRVVDACDLLEQIPHDVPHPWLAQIVAAVLLPDRSAWNQHDTDARPVPADMLVAVDLGGGRPLIDRAGVFAWGPGCGPAGEGRIHCWVRIEGASRPT